MREHLTLCYAVYGMYAATRQADHCYATRLRGSTARARPYLLLSGRTHLDLALDILNCVAALHL
jgi:hypothetical protein